MNLYTLCTRYAILVAVAITNLVLGVNGLFYTLFTPLTIYPSFYILNAAYGALFIAPNTIFFKGYFANIIPACVAGSAYFFLLVLNLTTPMTGKTRVKSLVFLLLSFLILNILRITIFSALVFQGYKYFEFAHLSTWYFGSTLMVVLLWFANVKLFKITSIPAYTDLKNLFALTKK